MHFTGHTYSTALDREVFDEGVHDAGTENIEVEFCDRLVYFIGGRSMCGTDHRFCLQENLFGEVQF